MPSQYLWRHFLLIALISFLDVSFEQEDGVPGMAFK